MIPHTYYRTMVPPHTYYRTLGHSFVTPAFSLAVIAVILALAVAVTVTARVRLGRVHG